MARITCAFALIAALAAACGEGRSGAGASETVEPAEETGSLVITANGEDLVRNGFTSVDGWNITFTHLYVTVSDVRVYQTDPPYDPHSGQVITGAFSGELSGAFTADLVQGGPGSGNVVLGTIEGVPSGHCNAMSWSMIPAAEGPSAGYSIHIAASGEKDGRVVRLELGIEDSYDYTAGEYVGDLRKGFVNPGETGELEITFHFDHIFGDVRQPPDDELNTAAVGFDPFASLASQGRLQVDLDSLSEIMSPGDFQKLLASLLTLGHTGEGHCLCVVR